MVARPRAIALGVLAALVIACGTSNIADDADVSITGTLLRPDGSPASGIAVGLMEEPSGFDALFEITVTVTTVGILCLTRQVSICKGSKRATTDADGGFSFTMKGKDTKTILGNPVHFLLSAQLDTGPRLQIRFEASETSIEVPQTAFWQPEGLTVKPGPKWVEYSWPPLKSKPLPRGYRLEVTEAEQVVWIQDAKPSGQLDSRAISDVQGEFHAVAIVENGSFTVEHHSQPVPLHGVAGAPPSRDAACTIAGPTAPAPIVDCLFTDGRYNNSFPRQTCSTASPAPTKCPVNTWVTVDLGTPRQVGTVFLHGLGLPSDSLIYTSDDGLKWSKRARHKPAQYAILTVDPPVVARYVRMQPPDDTNPISRLHEISIWP